MRVVLITVAPDTGGVWRHVRDLAIGLSARDHDVVVGTFPGTLESEANRCGLCWLPLSRAVLRRADVQHMHLHNTFDTRSLPAIATARTSARRLIITEHLPRVPASDPRLRYDPTLPPGRKKPGARRIKSMIKWAHATMADRIIVPGRSGAAFVARAWPASRTRVRIVPNGIDPRVVVHPLPSDLFPHEPLQLTSVGVLGWRKGNDILLEALSLIDADVRLTIVGDGPLRGQLVDQAASLPRGLVNFTGWVDDVDHHLDAADVLCLPSRSETFPYALLEGMAAARAALATSVDGPDEIIVHGRSGLLVPPEDPVALAAAIEMLASDRRFVSRLATGGRHRVLDNYGLDRMIDEIVRVYRES
jgi:glycosyltransferase involved in cell wall biosynthesis